MLLVSLAHDFQVHLRVRFYDQLSALTGFDTSLPILRRNISFQCV
jgi:hypothetical protein